MVTSIELYTYNPDNYVHIIIYTLYIIRKVCDVIIPKKS